MRSLILFSLLFLQGMHIFESRPLGDMDDLNLFDRLVSEKLSKIIAPLTLCRLVPDYMEQRMDELAVTLQRASEGQGGDRILNGLACAINMAEFMSWIDLRRFACPYVRLRNFYKSNIKSRYSPEEPPSITNVLIEKANNPFVVYRRKHVEIENFYKEWVKLPKREQELLVKAVEDAYPDLELKSNNGRHRSKRSLISIGNAIARTTHKSLRFVMKALMTIFKRVIQVGLKILDQFYMAPEFILKVPLIGDKVLEMRKKGEPIYKIVEFLRSTHYIYKVTMSQSSDQEINDPDKISRARRMIGEIGTEALNKLATALYKRFIRNRLNEDDRKEFITRILYSLLLYVLPEEGHCI